MEPRFANFCAEMGKRVRQLRLRRGMTQEDMTEHGFTIRHYQRIEVGRSITVVTIWKLAQALGVPPRSILPPGFSRFESRPAGRGGQSTLRQRR
jgi:transcriptional regulator with XRE-family HTH domain